MVRGTSGRVRCRALREKGRPPVLGSFLLMLVAVSGVAGCRAGELRERPAPGAGPAEAPAAASSPGRPAPLDADARAWVRRTLGSLSLREKIAQLVSVWVSGGYAATSDPELAKMFDLVERGLGGVTISIGLPYSFAAKLNALQERARVPLLVTSDFEAGPGYRLHGIYALPHVIDLGGGTEFPRPMAFGAIGDERFAFRLGRITGEEARAVGVQLDFAPVVDINSNPANPIINTRSFGEDPEQVARLGAAFIRGAHSAGLLTTAKHFPGHGDTRTDAHLELPVVPADRRRLDTLELVPFRRAIAAGVDAVMTAHVRVPAILGPDAPPATLSRYFLTEVLRTDLGFHGLVYTDALDMGAIVRRYGPGDAAVRALEAGADLLLMPADPLDAVDAVVAAVRGGRLTEARIDSSVQRLLETKARAGLHRSRTVELRRIPEVVGSREHVAFADSAAVRSLTLPRDRERLIPLDTARFRRILSLGFAREANLPAGRAFERELAGGTLELETARLGPESGDTAYQAVRSRIRSADLVVLSVYLPPFARSGGVAPPEALRRLVGEAVRAGTPVVLISFGNPYLLTDFPEVGTYLLAWGDENVSQRAAARGLLGRVPITGKLPISLPPFHRRGEGLRRPGVERAPSP